MKQINKYRSQLEKCQEKSTALLDQIPLKIHESSLKFTVCISNSKTQMN